MIKKIAHTYLILGTVFISLAFSPPSKAVFLVPGSGSYAFIAPSATLTQTIFGIPVSLTCDMVLITEVSEDGNNDAVIEIVDGFITGGASSTCAQIQLGFQSGYWYAGETTVAPIPPGSLSSGLFPSTTDPSTTTVSAYFHNVEITSPLGSCTGYMAFIFSNNESYAGPSAPSTIMPTSGPGSCTLSGTFQATISAGGFTSTAADINIYQ